MTTPYGIRIAALAVALASIVLPALAQKRVALVVGNAAYVEQPLKNPVNDARAMAAALRESGFEVILRENLAKPALEQAIGAFGEKLKAGDTGLFYYAGHAVQARGQNWLLPVDARIANENRLRIEAVDVDLAIEQMTAAGTKVTMVVLDACRDNPFERRFRSVGAGGGLAAVTAPEGTLIAYATAPGKVALDGDGRNSVYTAALARALRQPGLNVEDVFKRVRLEVSRATGGQQVPWESSSLTGDFVFKPGAAPPQTASLPAAALPAATPDPDAAERVFFETARDSKSAAMLDAYLQRYPQGRHVDEARALRAATPTLPVTAGRPFDGVYVGTYSCSAISGNAGSPPIVDSIAFVVGDHVARHELGTGGVRGYRRLEGTVTDVGAIEMSGQTYFDRYRVAQLAGTIDGEAASLEGFQDDGARRCRLEARRQQPAPRTAAATVPLPPRVAEQGGAAVSVEEMKREIVGRDMDVRLADGNTGISTLHADGRAQWRSRQTFTGTWRESARGYCTKYPDMRGGAERCYEFYRMPDGEYEAYEDVQGARVFTGRSRPRG